MLALLSWFRCLAVSTPRPPLSGVSRRVFLPCICVPQVAVFAGTSDGRPHILAKLMARRNQLPHTIKRQHKRLEQIIVTLKAMDWFERHRCLRIIERNGHFYWWHYCRLRLSPDEYIQGKNTGHRTKRVIKLPNQEGRQRQRKLTEFFEFTPRSMSDVSCMPADGGSVIALHDSNA